MSDLKVLDPRFETKQANGYEKQSIEVHQKWLSKNNFFRDQGQKDVRLKSEGGNLSKLRLKRRYSHIRYGSDTGRTRSINKDIHLSITYRRASFKIDIYLLIIADNKRNLIFTGDRWDPLILKFDSPNLKNTESLMMNGEMKPIGRRSSEQTLKEAFFRVASCSQNSVPKNKWLSNAPFR